MSDPVLKPRVTLLDSLYGEQFFDICRSVVDYGEQVGKWRFVGGRHPPFSTLEDLKRLNLDGIIGSFADHEAVDAVRSIGVPAINVSTGLKAASVPRVSHDDQAVGQMGAEHLLERGFAVFAFFANSVEWLSSQRQEGFKRGIEQAGRTCHLRDTNLEPETPKPELIRRWLLELPKPIAIMAVNDFMARLTINAAVELGLRVPDEVAVLGVNNYRWAVLMSSVPPSSIELSWARIGHLAAQALEGLMHGGAVPPPRYVPPLGVVLRRSTDTVRSDDPVVAHALRYIRDHVSTGIDAEGLLDELQLSRRTLDNRMKRATGQSLYIAICRLRVEQVKQMLIKTDASMERIARACSFDSQSRLNEVFKRLTGMTPGQFRQQKLPH